MLVKYKDGEFGIWHYLDYVKTIDNACKEAPGSFTVWYLDGSYKHVTDYECAFILDKHGKTIERLV
jgi:hypothetical protein